MRAALARETLDKILRAGSIPQSDEIARYVGGQISEAGARFLREVIRRNEPTSAEMETRLRAAAAALAAAEAALGSDELGITSTGHQALLNRGGRLRETLNRVALMMAAHSMDTPERAADEQSSAAARAKARVRKAIEGGQDLRRLVDAAVRQLEHEQRLAQKHEQHASQQDRVSHSDRSIEAVISGPPSRGRPGRGDDVFDRFLWTLWHIYVGATDRLPGTSVQSAAMTTAGQASGPLLAFCTGCLRWLDTQVPADLRERDAKLRKALASTPSALRARLQRVIRFGTMSRR